VGSFVRNLIGRNSIMKFINNGLSVLLATKPIKKTDPYYGKAKRLAKALGIQITIERSREYGNGYWIETDKIKDERFHTDWESLYQKLKEIEGLNA